MTTLLIVDDEPAVLSSLARALRHLFPQGLQVTTQSDPGAALQLMRQQPFDIILSDLRMPDIDGLTLLSLASAVLPHSVRMILTGTADFDSAQRAINDAGVFRFLTKPWTDADLKCHMQAAIAAVPASPPIDATQRELERLEALEPGLTAVAWGPAGEVLMPPLQD